MRELLKKLRLLVEEYERVKDLLDLSQRLQVGIPKSILPLELTNISEIDVGRTALNTNIKTKLQLYLDHLDTKIKETAQEIASL